MEKLKEALREELDKLEERFRTRKRKDDTGGRLGDRTVVDPERDPGGPRGRQRLPMGEDRRAEEASTCQKWTTR